MNEMIHYSSFYWRLI